MFSASNFIISVTDARLTSASGLLKADSTQLQLLSLGSSSSEQASTSKQQFPVEQPSYGASGSRESIFSLAGPGYMTARQSCSARALGCVLDQDLIYFLLLFLDLHKASSRHRSAMLDCEADNSGNSQQSLLEAASVQAQIIEGELSTFVVTEGKKNDELMHHWVPADPSPSVLVAATSSDSDSDDEALHSSNSRYDNHTPPCTGRTCVLRLMGEIRGASR